MSEQAPYQPGSEALASQMRQLVVGGKNYVTDLPEGVDVFGPTATTTKDDIWPQDLDKLHAGQYAIYAESDEPDQLFVCRQIFVRDGPMGPVVDHDSMRLPHLGGWIFNKETIPLMKALGFEFSADNVGEYISGVPTPQTLQGAAAQHGVDIKFFNKAKLESPDYLGAYKEGKYPVSFGYYEHDTEDDHITAHLLGGESMKQGLQRIASEALLQDRRAQNDVTTWIDEFTALFKVAFVTGFNTQVGSGASRQSSKDWAVDAGLNAGLTHEEVEAIFAEGLVRSEQFGVEIPGQAKAA